MQIAVAVALGEPGSTCTPTPRWITALETKGVTDSDQFVSLAHDQATARGALATLMGWDPAVANDVPKIGKALLAWTRVSKLVLELDAKEDDEIPIPALERKESLSKFEERYRHKQERRR